MNYIIEKTEIFDEWLKSLRDQRARMMVVRRMSRLESGNLGDVKTLGNGISEIRIDTGVGYRVYYTIRDRRIVFLLNGGDKSTQQTDIKRAIKLAKEV
ncbi:type II toxin-antitoxin system RelE/ParE family toxin [Oxalobacter formigenes]|uniref:type II toxin-antitoxin system RelE/ParE family toxin n=1 Tax=Oxalobacter formigenes TaxID=847 RepID=UPI00241C5D85|nr:type II toxin-antitoxin system RelE/ParE family toxin [Oxalobacter formigenes]